ncbi:hypothetical protein [Dactylosporangium sp. CA-139066]|uniref:hypothetical protein n=1 Tax=Dactylosporangium sp. CA-139066 TaxID=3239930 RepID=UPI003D936013
MTINPGSAEAPPGTREQAEHNLRLFLAEVSDRGGELAAAPVRVPEGDALGRYAFDLPAAGSATVRVLMPGVPVEAIRDDLRASAPCIPLGSPTCCVALH